MALQTLAPVDWRRFHDAEGVITKAGATVRCVDDVKDIISLLKDPQVQGKMTASGSHWALSTAGVSDGDFIELNWPVLTANVPRHSGLDVDLLHLINDQLFDFMAANPPLPPDLQTEDPCLSSGPSNCFFVHLKAGTRVYQAYSLLDRSPTVITQLADALNAQLAGGEHADAYSGPWSFATLGGAGGQTVYGALATGTHGGDYLQRPIADSVVAVHLVCDDGRHFWIEPEFSQLEMRLTDDDKLKAHYGNLFPGDASVRFKIIRDNDIFNSVIVGGWRFGVIASLVLRVVPQYCLHEHRRLASWRGVKQRLKSAAKHRSFDTVFFAGSPAEVTADLNAFSGRFGNPENFTNRFLQIAVNLSPDGNGDHLCGVSQRWFYPQAGPEARDPQGNLRGREERGTPATAGLAAAYSPPDDPNEAGTNSTFLTRACSSGNFIAGVLREVAKEIEQIVHDGVVPAAGIAVAALGIGAGAAVIAIAALCALLAAAAVALKALADEIEASGDTSLAEVVDKTVTVVVTVVPDPLSIMILRAIFREVFTMQQSNRDFVALSYAVMDTHDYTDRSCFGDAESIEVFFDAKRPDLYCAFVDSILSFEAAQQEQENKFSVGYVSLRYVKGSNGLIAPSRFEDTVVMEVAGIRKAAGSVPFVMNAATVARNPTNNASFHWGQFNPLTRKEVERHFGTLPASRLTRWRKSLQTVSGFNNRFSNAFTQQTGLEPS